MSFPTPEDRYDPPASDEYQCQGESLSSVAAFKPNHQVAFEPSSFLVDPFLQLDQPSAAASAPPVFSNNSDHRTSYQARKNLPCPQHCRDANGEPRLFAGRHHLQQHIRERHTQERPYKCPVCGPAHRGFNRAWTLNRHLGSIHGKRVGPGKGKTTRNKVQVVSFVGETEQQPAVNAFDLKVYGNHRAPGSQVVQSVSGDPHRYPFATAQQPNITTINLCGYQPIPDGHLIHKAFGGSARYETESLEQPHMGGFGAQLDSYASLNIAAGGAMSMEDLFDPNLVSKLYTPSSSNKNAAWDGDYGFTDPVCDIGGNSDFEISLLPEEQEGSIESIGA